MTEEASYPSLAGRNVFVTGGGSGIGAAIVELFCRQRANVFFVDINAEAAADLIARIEAQGCPAPEFIACDLRDIDALQAAIRDVIARAGPIRALVNNAERDGVQIMWP